MLPKLRSHDDPAAFRETFAADIASSLCRRPRQISSKYLYDDLGSALFEAICRLPWYRITRAESSLLVRHAREIIRPLQRPVSLAELGCGSGEKIALMVSAAGESFPLIQLIDISEAALDMARYRLQAIGVRSILTHHFPYEQGLIHAVQQRPREGSLVVLFLGSNIGNFTPAVARELLVRIRRSLRPGDALLLGADLVKPEDELMLAYDDPLDVTAAFNRNLLRRINDELGGNFDLEGFSHRVVWNPIERRVEVYLESLKSQRVIIAASRLAFDIAEGEAIWTESSYKYEPGQVTEEGLAAGFTGSEQWIDQDAKFALTRFTIEG